ncbi:MAG: MBL fold metallo-hydrolase [Ignavibacteriales bacterium]|nr:MBL fold metallo-hydrolase [Ignavibacteriales bacterium]
MRPLRAIAAAGIAATLLAAAAVGLNGRAASRTQLVLLGTGTPNADPERFGPAVAIVVDDVPYLVDFGPGVVRRAAAAFARGVKGLDPKRLRTAFATHLHSDHTAGYPDLIFTPAVLERDAPLQRHAPSRYPWDDRTRPEGLGAGHGRAPPRPRTGQAGRLPGACARGKGGPGPPR